MGVTHLLGFQRQLNKDLLQLFVDKVDAKLLKAVPLKERSNMVKIATPRVSFHVQCVRVMCVYLENLKAIDVQYANIELLMVLLHGFVDALSKTHAHGQ